MRIRQVYTDEQRIGACADYLLGKPYTIICDDWDVRMATVYKWIRKTGSFKFRRQWSKPGVSE